MTKNILPIPEQFELFGQTIHINFVADLMYRKDAYGETNPRNNTINLQKHTQSIQILRTVIEVTYLHEVIHLICLALGEEEFGQDETRVDRWANALHQIFISSKYENEDNAK